MYVLLFPFPTERFWLCYLLWKYPVKLLSVELWLKYLICYGSVYGSKKGALEIADDQYMTWRCIVRFEFLTYLCQHIKNGLNFSQKIEKNVNGVY